MAFTLEVQYVYCLSVSDSQFIKHVKNVDYNAILEPLLAVVKVLGNQFRKKPSVVRDDVKEIVYCALNDSKAEEEEIQKIA